MPGATLVYSTCPPNSHIPVGASIAIEDLVAIVSLGRHERRDFIEVRLDIPAGKTVILDGGALTVETSEPKSLAVAEFPNVSLVDTPIINSYSPNPDRLSIAAPLVGGRYTVGNMVVPNKHFWLATYVDTANAAEVWITLPRFTLNGVATNLPRLHFERQTMLAIAVINC